MRSWLSRGTRDQRPGALPARFMVYYVLALALFQQDSYDDVAENLVGALEGMDEAIPARSSFTGPGSGWARGDRGGVPLSLAEPVAPAGLDGAFWRGMRVAAVDGFVLGRAGHGGEPGRVRRAGRRQGPAGRDSPRPGW